MATRFAVWANTEIIVDLFSEKNKIRFLTCGVEELQRHTKGTRTLTSRREQFCQIRFSYDDTLQYHGSSPAKQLKAQNH